MTAFTEDLSFLFTAAFVVFAALFAAALFYLVTGRRFSDKLAAASLTSTLVVDLLLLLCVFLGLDYLVDIAILYTLLSFLSVTVLSRLVSHRNRGELEKLDILARTEPLHSHPLDPHAHHGKYRDVRNLLKYSLEEQQPGVGRALVHPQQAAPEEKPPEEKPKETPEEKKEETP